MTLYNIGDFDLLFKYFGTNSNIRLDTTDTCKILGISHVTLQKYKKEGRIRGYQLPSREWKYSLTDIYDFLKAKYLKKISRNKNLRQMIEELPQGTMRIEPNRWKGRSGEGTRRPEGQPFDAYRFFWVEDGWLVISNQPMLHISEEGQIRLCHPSGFPFFIASLEHDGVEYPNGLPSQLNTLWTDFQKNRITREKLSDLIEKIGKWINLCEQAFPSYTARYPFDTLTESNF